MKFKLALLLARLGFFKYNGMLAFAKYRRMTPMAQVRYHRTPAHPFDGFSIPMSIGNAVEYARMFNGTVVPVQKR